MSHDRPLGPGFRENVLEFGLLLGEDTDDEVSVQVGLEGGGQDQVLPRGQAEAAAHFAQVDEGVGPSCRRVAQEEVPVQVDVPLPRVLGEPHIHTPSVYTHTHVPSGYTHTHAHAHALRIHTHTHIQAICITE